MTSAFHSKRIPVRLLSFGCALIALTSGLSGCVPLVLGGAAVGGTMVATDRRGSSAVLNDEGIELSAGSKIFEAVGGSSHVNVTSWDGLVLLTGEVQTEQEKERAQQVAQSVKNVRQVINELAVMPSSGLVSRSNDSFITTKVKTKLAQTEHVSTKDVKVITERGITYLMGKVTPAEAEAATEATRTVSGVTRVIRAFEYADPSQVNAKAVPAQPSYPGANEAQTGTTSSTFKDTNVTPAPVTTITPTPTSSSTQTTTLPPLEPAQTSPVSNSSLR